MERTNEPDSVSSPRFVANYGLGLIGASMGALAGYFLFKLLLGQNLYALALPGALIGIGCGVLSRIHSRTLGVVCAIAALALGIMLEWQHFPFLADDSLSFFVTHLHQLKGFTMVMLVLGVLGGFWFGTGRSRVG